MRHDQLSVLALSDGTQSAQSATRAQSLCKGGLQRMTSTGVFACWQPQYAEQGIATFPVKDKRPCIRGWQKIGLKGSSELASKYANADAFGFQCGARSRITIIDIDSHDEGMVGEAVKLSPRMSMGKPGTGRMRRASPVCR